MTTTAFATFKASKRRSETLADDLGIDAHSVSQGGYLYDGGHYIEDNTLGCAETQAQGKHHLAIGQRRGSATISMRWRRSSGRNR